MGFTVEARKARDQTLPYAQRVRPLLRCLELYSPLGFTVTWDYLEHRAGTFWHHRHKVHPLDRTDSALVTALELLAESRAAQTAETVEFAAVRAEQKRLGRRALRPGQTTPWYPPRWHADPRGAARFVLEREAPPARLRPLIDAAFDGDRTPDLQAEALKALGELKAGLRNHPLGTPLREAYRTINLAEHLRVAVGAY